MFKFNKAKTDETVKELENLQASVNKLEKKIKTLEKEKAELAKTVTTQNKIIQVLDSGVFLSIYSLSQGESIKFPTVHTPEDVINTGVSDNINRMMEIINKVNQETAEKTKAEKSKKAEKKSKK